MEEKLLSNLNETKEIIDKITKLNKDKERYYKSPFQSCLLMAIIFVIIIAICSWFLGLLAPGLNKNIFAWILKEVICSVITIIILLLLETFIPKIRVLIYKDVIKSIEEEVLLNYKILENNSELPKAYWNSYAVNKLIEYFINKRADNIKEALNLLELDYKHKEKMEMLEEINLQA
jgi:hypothetical protein